MIEEPTVRGNTEGTNGSLGKIPKKRKKNVHSETSILDAKKAHFPVNVKGRTV